ncbi:MAG: hypothetical protein R3F34_09010 [Planctomycetota bacterium]
MRAIEIASIGAAATAGVFVLSLFLESPPPPAPSAPSVARTAEVEGTAEVDTVAAGDVEASAASRLDEARASGLRAPLSPETLSLIILRANVSPAVEEGRSAVGPDELDAPRDPGPAF